MVGGRKQGIVGVFVKRRAQHGRATLAWAIVLTAVAVSSLLLVNAGAGAAPAPVKATPHVATPAASVPSAPGHVAAKRGVRAAFLTWRAPVTAGGSGITGYVVTRYYHGKAQFSKTFNSIRLSAVMAGLPVGRPFTFRVAARNGVGVGPMSQPSNMIGPASPTRPDTPPQAGGYFQTSPPGSALPSGSTCAERVHYSPWEPIPSNSTANHHTPGWPVSMRAHPDFNSTFAARFRPRINGDFVGTTDEIIQWAACKWGIADDIVRAQAVDESHWQMNEESDYEPRSNGHCAQGDNRDPCPTSFGILQIKWYYNPDTNPVNNSYPHSKTMTAFSLDYTLANLRGCYEGWQYFGAKTRGDLMGCLGAWYSGGWHDSGANGYISRVQGFLADKEWRSW